MYIAINTELTYAQFQKLPIQNQMQLIAHDAIEHTYNYVNNFHLQDNAIMWQRQLINEYMEYDFQNQTMDDYIINNWDAPEYEDLNEEDRSNALAEEYDEAVAQIEASCQFLIIPIRDLNVIDIYEAFHPDEKPIDPRPLPKGQLSLFETAGEFNES